MSMPTATAGGLRSAWIAILALSPLAYFGATLLEDRLPHDPPFVSIGRDRAIRQAIGFAQTLGVDARAWTPTVEAQGRKNIASLLRHIRPPSLQRIFAPATLNVTLRSQDGSWVVVNVSPDGRVMGFSRKKLRDGTAIDEAGARRAAEEFLRRQLGTDNPFHLQEPVARDINRHGWEREFTWTAAIPELPKSTIKFHVDVTGDQPASETFVLQLDEDSKRLAESSSTLSSILGTIAGFTIGGLAIYAIVRYVQRSLEKEISHRRTLLVAVSFVITGLLALLVNGGSAEADVSGEPATGLARIVLLTLGAGFLGVSLGIAYGAGEGDLRETYPGKLVSLDAFLSGKWLSANCARSILAGGAVAGWLLLAQNALFLVRHTAPATDYSGIAGAILQKSPLLQGLSDLYPDITLMASFGLMVPLTLLHSRLRRRWLVVSLLLVICAVVSSTIVPAHAAPDYLMLLPIWTAAICLPFFYGDLMAAISALTALDFVDALLRKSVVSAEWHTIAYNHVLPFGIGFLLVEIYCAWRGRIYDEKLVRPLYARHLAERLALSAEIGAARLAQVRLLPEAAPRIAGLSVAGSCTPAREVGGDFFDYYVLDEHRLGVFVAEGGSRELGSAMAIALAKGFLMYTARLDLSPAEVLRRLRATLGSVLRGEDAPMTVLYAVIDGRNGSLRYARSGASPRVVVNGHALAEEIAGPEIRHGAAMLAPNDVLFFYTDGWSFQIGENTRRVPDAFLRDLIRKYPAADADALHKAALDAAIKRRKEAPPDDVTAVVVRREEAAAVAIGGLA